MTTPPNAATTTTTTGSPGSATTVVTDTTNTDSDAGKTFTQAEVDGLIKKRAERVAAEKYGDYADLKSRASKLDQIEAANATEQEKAVKAARAEGMTEERTRTNTILARAEARALAAEAMFQDPSDAVAFLSLADVKVADDGTVDPDELKAQLKDLADRKPYLLKTKPETTASQAGIGVTGSAPIDDSPRSLITAGLAKTTKNK